MTVATAAPDLAPPPVHHQAMMLRVRAYIEERLGDPDLSSTTIAAAHHISVRYLQKMFEASGITAAEWIRWRRIERCRSDLLDPRLEWLTVSAIGCRWGFVDAAHFSWVFKQLVGVAPSAIRNPNREPQR